MATDDAAPPPEGSDAEVITLRERRMRIMERLQASAAESILPGPCAARSQDFLYDEDGLPG